MKENIKPVSNAEMLSVCDKAILGVITPKEVLNLLRRASINKQNREFGDLCRIWNNKDLQIVKMKDDIIRC